MGGRPSLLRMRGFFGIQPMRLWWVAFHRRFGRAISGGCWRHGCPLARWRYALPPPGWRLQRLSRRDVVNLLLAATAVFFFAGWFDRPEPEPRSTLPVAVWREDTQQTVVMDLEEYLKGVVAAEMPATFHLEALKAQAVASRTYALHIMSKRQAVPGHPEAMLSTDHRVDQAWTSETTLRKRYGFLEYYWRWRRIGRAVDETRGIVITYAGEPILAVFHSDSGGITEDSENYWTSRLAYLRSVPDPVPAETPYKETKLVLPRATVERKVRGVPEPGIPVAVGVRGADGATPRTKPLVEVLARYPSGRVKSVRVGSRNMTGRALREALNLRSVWFDVRDDGENLQFIVRGNGHGVGMSQFGSDAFARQGASFQRILQHYYTGVQLTTWYR